MLIILLAIVGGCFTLLFVALAFNAWLKPNVIEKEKDIDPVLSNDPEIISENFESSDDPILDFDDDVIFEDEIPQQPILPKRRMPSFGQYIPQHKEIRAETETPDLTSEPADFISAGKQEAPMGDTKPNDDPTPIYEPEIVSDDYAPLNQLSTRQREQSILDEVTRIKNRPNVLVHYFESILGRIITRQNDKTAQQDMKFLKTVIEQLGVKNQFQEALDKVELHEKDRKIKELKLQLEHGKIENQLKTQEALRGLELQRDELKIRVEMAELNKKMSDLNKPSGSPQSSLTDEEIRTQKRKDLLEKRAKRKKEEEEELQRISKGRKFEDLTDEEQQEYMLIKNAYTAAYERLFEDLSKLLL